MEIKIAKPNLLSQTDKVKNTILKNNPPLLTTNPQLTQKNNPRMHASKLNKVVSKCFRQEATILTPTKTINPPHPIKPNVSICVNIKFVWVV